MKFFCVETCPSIWERDGLGFYINEGLVGIVIRKKKRVGILLAGEKR